MLRASSKSTLFEWNIVLSLLVLPERTPVAKQAAGGGAWWSEAKSPAKVLTLQWTRFGFKVRLSSGMERLCFLESDETRKKIPKWAANFRIGTVELNVSDKGQDCSRDPSGVWHKKNKALYSFAFTGFSFPSFVRRTLLQDAVEITPGAAALKMAWHFLQSLNRISTAHSQCVPMYMHKGTEDICPQKNPCITVHNIVHKHQQLKHQWSN